MVSVQLRGEKEVEWNKEGRVGREGGGGKSRRETKHSCWEEIFFITQKGSDSE